MSDATNTENTETKPVIDASNPEVQALVQKLFDEKAQGLTKKNQELIQAQKQLKQQFEGVDLEEYRKLKTFMEQNEEAQLLAQGKTDEVFKRRSEKLIAEYDAKVKAAIEESQTWQQKADAYRAQVEQLKIDDVVTRAMIKAGAVEGADEDARLLARQLFRLEDDGIVGRDAKGNLLTGKSGALTLDEWVDQLKTNKSHWFNKAQGVGAKGSGNKGVSTQKRSAMSDSEKVNFIKEHGQAAFLALPQ